VCSFIKEQIKLRNNALQQAEQLLEYKRAICHHPSHRKKSNHHNNRSRGKNNKAQDDKNIDGAHGGGGGGGLLSIFVSLLAEPLGKSRRTDADHLTIELVLHLFRNLLAAEPLLNSSPNASNGAAASRQLHHELIALLHQELVLEILLVLAADLEQSENAPYNLLVMEILQHLFRHEDPMAVARIGSSSSSSSSSSGTHSSKQHKSGAGGSAAGANDAAAVSAKPSLLGQTLLREKQALAVPTMNRHSNFGGTLVLKRPQHTDTDIKHQYVSTASFLAQRNESAALSGGGGGDHGAARRKNKRNEPFIGAKTSRLQHGRNFRNGGETMGPAAQKAACVLHDFCRRFCQRAYGPVMKSLKNEFRRDSVRLEDGDRVVFFRLVWFFSQWWRVTTSSGKHALEATPAEQSPDNKKPGASSLSSSTAIGQLIFTMDVFTFNLVLNATDTFVEHKKYGRLAQAVALLAEMMHLLFVLHNSPEPTETVMAMGLMDRLFYSSDPMDRLPKLLSKWEPGTGTREYACDLVEVCHMQLKLLESTRSKAAADKDVAKLDVKKKNKKGKKKSATDDDDDDSTPNDAVTNMKAIAADFDVESYLRKLFSNQNVILYTQLLSQYVVNAPQVNHRIVAFFLRLSKFKIILPENDVDEQDAEMMMTAQHPLAIKTVTLEPMLYTIHMLMVLTTILNDVIIRNDKDYTTTLQFASTLMFHFSQAASANPMLYVETFLKHASPTRYCDSITNQYVTEELRMMVERDMLREDQQRQREEIDFEGDDDNKEGETVLVVNNNSSNTGNDTNKNGQVDDKDSDEELEFEDIGLISGSNTAMESSKRPRKGKAKKRKVVLEDSDDDGNDSDDDDAAAKKPSTQSTPPSTSAAKTGSDNNQDLDDSDDDNDYNAAKNPPSNHSKSPLSAAAKQPSDEDLDESDGARNEAEIVKKTSRELETFLKSQDDSSSSDESFAAEAPNKSNGQASTPKKTTGTSNLDDSDDSSMDENGTGGKENLISSNKRKSLDNSDNDDDDSLSSGVTKKKKNASGESATSPEQDKKARTNTANDDDDIELE
jgi:timeless